MQVLGFKRLRNILDSDDLIRVTQKMDAVMGNQRRGDKMLRFIKRRGFIDYMKNTG